MDIELFQAFRQAGVDEPTAKAAVASINQQIDSRYTLHAAQLFTKADGLQLEAKLAELKADLIKWCMGAIFASTALFAAVAKLLH